MRKRTSDYSSFDMESQRIGVDRIEDMSLLLPAPLGPSTFLAVKTAFESSADSEVRRLLAEECSLIFECNACRNMFRDPINFISHKKFYCCVAAPAAATCAGGSGNGFPDPNENAMVALVPAAPSVDGVHNGNVSSSSSVNVEPAEVDASGLMATEMGLGFEHQLQVTGEGQATSETEQPAKEQCIIKKELVEEEDVDSLITKMENVLCSSAEQAPRVDQREQHNSVPGSVKYPCGICKMEFQTEKSVKSHVQKKHMAAVHAFKCPSCTLTFMQPAAVIRHLANDHKKSVRRIRMTRDHSAKRRSQPDDMPAKSGSNRELKRLQSTDGQSVAASTTDCDGNEKKKVMSNCIYCEKSFERRAALSTHLMSCRVKLEALEKPTPVKRPRLHASLFHLSASMDNVSKNELTAATLPADGNMTAPAVSEPLASDMMDKLVIKTEFSVANSLNELFANLDKQMFEPGLRTVTLDKLEPSSSEGEQESQSSGARRADSDCEREARIAAATTTTSAPTTATSSSEFDGSAQPTADYDDVKGADSGNNSTKPKEELASESDSSQKAKTRELSCRCKICNKQFSALSNLRRHISMFHYRARKFGCKLCDYRAFRRYDIVNHLCFVHKMTDDREEMATVYVSVHEVHYSKDDMDGDIVLINGESPYVSNSACATAAAAPSEPPSRSCEKRPKRNTKAPTISQGGSSAATAAAAPAARTAVVVAEPVAVAAASANNDCKPPTRQKLKRAAAAASSALAFDGGAASKTAQQRRPIRNRIKPENKDFVYDLSSLLKGEATPQAGGDALAERPQPLRQLKRRNTIYNSASAAETYEAHKTAAAPLLGGGRQTAVRGATRRICQRLVQLGLAKSATLPELPAERPQMRPRLTSTCRVDMQAVPVIETSDLEAARRQATLLGDSFLEKISRRAASEFRIKPCVQHSALDTLLQKVDDHQQQHNGVAATTTAAAVVVVAEAPPHEPHSHQPAALNSELLSTAAGAVICQLAAGAGSALAATATSGGEGGKHFAEPLPSIPCASSPPPTPRKRITLVQRMAENKAKHRDSLLRTALEN